MFSYLGPVKFVCSYLAIETVGIFTEQTWNCEHWSYNRAHLDEQKNLCKEYLSLQPKTAYLYFKLRNYVTYKFYWGSISFSNNTLWNINRSKTLKKCMDPSQLYDGEKLTCSKKINIFFLLRFLWRSSHCFRVLPQISVRISKYGTNRDPWSTAACGMCRGVESLYNNIICV